MDREQTAKYNAARKYLLELLSGYKGKNIYPSRCSVIERLINSEKGMLPYYCAAKPMRAVFPGADKTWPELDVLVDVAAAYTPNQLNTLRDDVKRVDELNSEIAEVATKLAGLLEKRDTYRDRVDCPDDTNPIEVLMFAGEYFMPFGDNHFASVKPELERLVSQYLNDGYWPKTSDLISALVEINTSDISGNALPVGDTNHVSLLVGKNKGSKRGVCAALYSELEKYGATGKPMTHKEMAEALSIAIFGNESVISKTVMDKAVTELRTIS